MLSAIGGFPEVAELGAAALVPPGDPAALHAALAALLARPRRAGAARGRRAGRRRRPAVVGRARRELTLEVYRAIAR